MRKNFWVYGLSCFVFFSFSFAQSDPKKEPFRWQDAFLLALKNQDKVVSEQLLVENLELKNFLS